MAGLRKVSPLIHLILRGMHDAISLASGFAPISMASSGASMDMAPSGVLMAAIGGPMPSVVHQTPPNPVVMMLWSGEWF